MTTRYRSGQSLSAILLASSIAVMSSAPVYADKKADPATPAAVNALLACRTETANDSARLACYDQAVAAFATAREKREITIIDKDEEQRTRKSLFGFNLPRVSLFGDGGHNVEVKEINSKISGLRSLGYGKWAFTLEDGAHWQTTEPLGGFDPKNGSTVKISRGALGSYSGNFDNGRFVKMQRVN